MHKQRVRVRLIEILLAGVIGGLVPSVVAQTLTGVTGVANQHAVTNLASLTQVTDAGSGPPATPTNFLAVADNGTQDPPFPGGAVGTNHIVSTLDHVIRVQTRTGTNLYTVGVTNFWAAVGPYSEPRGPFDPKVVYDPYNDRWMMTAVADYNTNSSAVLVGVTQTGDPSGAWNLYRVNINTNAVSPKWANFPNIGFNKDWIVVAVTAYPISSGLQESQLYVFSKTNLYANGTGSYRRLASTNYATYGVVQEPCAMYDNIASNLYLVTDRTGQGGNGSLRLFYIDGPVGSAVLHVGPDASSGSPWSGGPPTFDFGPQLGSTEKIELDDSRLQNAVYRNGSIWTTHTIFLPAGAVTRAAIQWWQINPNGTILQRGRIDDSSGQIFYAYPSIAVNQLNDAFIGCARFSASNYASAYFALRSHNDATNTFQTPMLLKAGDVTFARSSPPLRWGDHTSTVVDPVNDLDFWTIQEYATSTNSQSRWGTWWGKVVGAFVDLSLTKTASLSPAITGSNLTYTITVTNLSAAPAASVTVTDPLPASVTFLSASASQGTCTNVNGTVTCNLSTLGSNAAASVQIVVVPTAVGALTNVAGVTAATSDPILANNAMTNIVTVTAPTLSVTPVNRDFGVLTVGQTSTQTFSIVNSGGGSLTGTAAVMGVAFELASASNFNLGGGQTDVVSVTFNPGAAGSFTGSVTFASNGGSSTNQLAGTAVTPPQLGVSPASFNFGATITGTTAQTTFVVTNSGQSILTGTTSVAGATFAVVSGATYSVPSFGSSNVVVSFAPATAGNFTNQVIFNSNGGVSSNSVTGTGVTPARLDVSPTSFNFGTIATGVTAQTSFVVTNKGGAALSGSAAIGTGVFAIAGGSPFNFNVAGFAATNLIASFTPTSAGSFATNLIFTSNGGNSTNALSGTGAITPVAAFSANPTNGFVPLAVTFTNESSGTITNASWDFGDGATTNTFAASVQHSYQVPGTNTVTLVVTGPVGVSTNIRSNYIVARIPTADLTLTNTGAPNPVPQGQSLTYTLTVGNGGPDTAASVTITDSLPASVSFVSATSSQGSCTNIAGTLICDFSSMPVASNAVVSVVVTPLVVGAITNRAVIFTGTTDPNLSNNTGTVAVVVAPTADLAVTQTTAPNPVLTSQNLTYTLLVTNLGPSAASSVTVTDALPAGFSFVSASASQGTCSNTGGIVTCSLGTLSTNALATMAITVAPSASSNVTNISNTATVTATEFDPTTTNNTATASVVVYRDADNDGIPDYWTHLYFGHDTGQAADHSRAEDDADGDGFSNEQEYLAGTSPVDAGSALRIITAEANGTNIVIRFSSVTEKRYRLEWSDEPDSSWTNVVADNLTGTGDVLQVIDSDIVTPQRYYRVRLLP